MSPDPNNNLDALGKLSGSSSGPSMPNSSTNQTQQNNPNPLPTAPQKKGSSRWGVLILIVMIVGGCVAYFQTKNKSKQTPVESPFEKAMTKVKQAYPELKLQANSASSKSRFESGNVTEPCNQMQPKDVLPLSSNASKNDPSALLTSAAQYQAKIIPNARIAAKEWNASLLPETKGLLTVDTSPRSTQAWGLCVPDEDVKFLLSVKTVLKNINKFPAIFYQDPETSLYFKGVQTASAITATKNKKDNLAYLLSLKYEPTALPASQSFAKLLESLK